MEKTAVSEQSKFPENVKAFEEAFENLIDIDLDDSAKFTLNMIFLSIYFLIQEKIIAPDFSIYDRASRTFIRGYQENSDI